MNDKTLTANQKPLFFKSLSILSGRRQNQSQCLSRTISLANMDANIVIIVLIFIVILLCMNGPL